MISLVHEGDDIMWHWGRTNSTCNKVRTYGRRNGEYLDVTFLLRDSVPSELPRQLSCFRMRRLSVRECIDVAHRRSSSGHLPV